MSCRHYANHQCIAAGQLVCEYSFPTPPFGAYQLPMVSGRSILASGSVGFRTTMTTASALPCYLDPMQFKGSTSMRKSSGLPAVLFAIVAAAAATSRADTRSTGTNDPAPDEISYFGERVYSLRQWPPDSGYGVSYRRIFAP